MQRFHEPLSGFLHLFGALAALIGLIFLIVLTHDNLGKLLTMVIYGLSLVMLYAASSALHLIKAPPTTHLLLTRLDHAAIFALIAGTFTPFAYNLLSGLQRWLLLSSVWVGALIGIVYKLRYHHRASHFGTLAYVGLGIAPLLALPQLIKAIPPIGIGLIVGGGAIYILGTLFYSFDDPRNRPRYINLHDLWHLFVLSASGLHFAAVLRFVAI